MTRLTPRTKPWLKQLGPENEYAGPVTVLCVLRESRLFDAGDVNRLYRAIRDHTAREFTFHVLTDSGGPFERGIIPVPVRHLDWNPKYNKIEMFRPDVLDLGERFFYADLDTAIVGSLDDLFAYDGDLCMLRDFYMDQAFASGVMAWSKDIGPEIYDDFVAMPGGRRKLEYPIGGGRGDQSFIANHTPFEPHRFQDVWPGQVVSYKVDCRKNGTPENARMVCFHGDPKLKDVPEYAA